MKHIINKLKIHNRIRAGYGTAFFLLLISYLFTLLANRELLEQADRVDHTNKIITGLETILSDVKDGETGLRGYMIMKDPHFLDPYYTSKSRADSVYSFLRNRTVDNPLQQERLDTLRQLINQKFEIMQYGLSAFRENNFQVTDSIKAETYRGKKTMDLIRSLIVRMQIREDNILRERKAGVSSKFTALNAIVIVSLVIAFLMLIFGFLTYLRENKARRMADEKVQEYQQQLVQRIGELDSANKELVQMRSQEKFAATGRIARTIAHEIRNPLTNINLAMEQLKSEIQPVDESNTILFDMISRNSNRINQLITDLLNSTKFAELTYNNVSVNTLLDEALELAKDRITLNSITVQKKYSEDICEVTVDKEKLRIAFLNIIVNAIEAMEPGKGILKINTRNQHDKCVVEISDNGMGMDQESVGKLFEPYFTNKPKGNGLGLTNTQNIILNHKGTIHVESEKGKGAAFIIILNFA